MPTRIPTEDLPVWRCTGCGRPRRTQPWQVRQYERRGVTLCNHCSGRLREARRRAGVTVLALFAAGCNMPEPRAPTAPVRASDGAAASLTIIACPPSEARAMAVGELIDQITRQDELVTARSGGSARLVINACPHGTPVVQSRR